MGDIYCLYSDADGIPRYVGQTEDTAERRRRKHIAKALEKEGGPLYDWMRQVFENNGDVHVHVLQTAVPPCDLDMFESYWMEQFVGLLNSRRGGAVPDRNTGLGEQVTTGIRTQLGTVTTSK